MAPTNEPEIYNTVILGKKGRSYDREELRLILSHFGVDMRQAADA
jgi:hypothetical protein